MLFSPVQQTVPVRLVKKAFRSRLIQTCFDHVSSGYGRVVVADFVQKVNAFAGGHDLINPGNGQKAWNHFFSHRILFMPQTFTSNSEMNQLNCATYWKCNLQRNSFVLLWIKGNEEFLMRIFNDPIADPVQQHQVNWTAGCA